MEKNLLAKLRHNEGHFIKTPNRGDRVKIYMNDGGIQYARVIKVVRQKRDRLIVQYTNQEFSLLECDYCLPECLIYNGKANLNGLSDIVGVVANKFGVTIDEMQYKSRELRYVLPRQVAHYICSKHTDKSVHEISKIGACDRTTVLHSIKKVCDLIQYDTKLYDKVQEIEKLIRV